MELTAIQFVALCALLLAGGMVIGAYLYNKLIIKNNEKLNLEIIRLNGINKMCEEDCKALKQKLED